MRKIILIATMIFSLMLLGNVYATSCTYAWDCPERVGYSRICSNYVNGIGECSYYDDDARCFAVGYWINSCNECCYYCCSNHKCVIGASECGTSQCGDAGQSCTYNSDCCSGLICGSDRKCKLAGTECTSDAGCEGGGNLVCSSHVAGHLVESHCMDGTCRLSLTPCASLYCNEATNQCEEVPCLPDGSFSPFEIKSNECCSGSIWTGEIYGVKHWFCGKQECPNGLSSWHGLALCDATNFGKAICDNGIQWRCDSYEITNDNTPDVYCWKDKGECTGGEEDLISMYSWVLIVAPIAIGYLYPTGSEKKRKGVIIGAVVGGIIWYLYQLPEFSKLLLGVGIIGSTVIFFLLGGGALIMYFLARRNK